MPWGNRGGRETVMTSGTEIAPADSFLDPPGLQTLALEAIPPPCFHFKLGFYCHNNGVQRSSVHSAAEPAAMQHCVLPYYVSLPQGKDRAVAMSPQVGAHSAVSPGGLALLQLLL